MKDRWFTLVAAAVAVAIGSTTAAEARASRENARPEVGAGRVETRQEQQKDRIRAGVKERSITKTEAKQLTREQKRIENTERRAEADGKVTAKERARLEREQDRASRHIFLQRHDAQGNVGPLPRNWKTWDPGVNQRQRNQKFRVAQGIKTGSLTREEVQTIIQQEIEIAKLEKEFKSDGKLTVEERKQLHQMLNETSKLIYGEKHDDETRPKLNTAIVKKIESGELTPEEAKELCVQMRRIHELKRLLGGDQNLTDEQRALYQDELDALVANLHE